MATNRKTMETLFQLESTYLKWTRKGARSVLYCKQILRDTDNDFQHFELLVKPSEPLGAKAEISGRPVHVKAIRVDNNNSRNKYGADVSKDASFVIEVVNN